MKMMTRLIVAFCLGVAPLISSANETALAYPIAIFNFDEQGRALEGMGKKVGQVLFSRMVVDPDITLVDRQDLEKLEDEAALNLSGMVNQQQAIQVGQLTGARMVVTGTVFEIEDRLMIVAKVIGTETSRVLGASVEGDINDSVLDLTNELSTEIVSIIGNNAEKLVAEPVSNADRLAILNDKLAGGDKPTLAISISEQHIDRVAPRDPAAETEMLFFSKESGFEVLESGSETAKRADVLIVGEGFTQRAAHRGDLISVKARVEVKAVEQSTKRVLAVDRQTEVKVGVSEMIAAKSALQAASAKLAGRLLPKLVNR